MKEIEDTARQIVIKMQFQSEPLMFEQAKQCALIAVDVIIDLLPNINLIPPIERRPDEFYAQYWLGVKRRIERL